MEITAIASELLEDGRYFCVGQSEDGWPLYFIKDPFKNTYTIVCDHILNPDGTEVAH